MKLSQFNYSETWPLQFSPAFVHYMNNNINGDFYVFEHNDVYLPVLVKKKLQFKIGSFIHVPLLNGEELTLESEKKFFLELIDFLESNNFVDFILPPPHFGVFKHIPLKSSGYELGIIKLPLMAKSEEDLFNSFKSGFRRDIRKAKREGVEIKFGIEHFDTFYNIYQEKMLIENSFIDSKETIWKLISDLNTNNVLCGVSFYNGDVDTVLLNFNDQNSAFYTYGATTSRSHAGSLKLLHWEAIKKYKKTGLKYYQFGGARRGEMLTIKHERLSKFKKGFGGITEDGYHFTLILKPLKFKLYKKLISLKSKL